MSCCSSPRILYVGHDFRLWSWLLARSRLVRLRRFRARPRCLCCSLRRLHPFFFVLNQRRAPPLLRLQLHLRRRDRPRPRPRILHDPRLGLPPRVGLRSKQLDPLLPRGLGALLVERRGVAAGVPQPLVPLGADLDLGEVRRARVGDDAAPALGGVLCAAGVAEFPEGVALEVEACTILDPRFVRDNTRFCFDGGWT